MLEIPHLPQASSAPGQRLTAPAWPILIAFTASILLWRLGSAHYFTGHECYVVQGAREMLATGDWVVPRIAGQPWLEKPPLAHWATALAGALLGGVDEFTGRLPAALCGLAGVLLLAALVARCRGTTLGLLTGLTQTTCVYFVTYARLAEADIYLWVLVVACLVVFAGNWVEPAAPRRWYNSRLVFFFLLGMTQLVKGPMFGAVLVLLPCAAFLLSQPRWSCCRWLLWLPGWLLFAVLGAAWLVLILIEYPEALGLWWYHTVSRLGSESCFNPEPVWYYCITLPWQILPWTLVMLPALPASLRRAWHEPRSLDRFVWLWLLVPFVVLSAVRAKHHHYLIHVLPPCSYWAALGLLRWRTLPARLWTAPGWRWGMLAGLAALLGVGLWISRVKGHASAFEVLLAVLVLGTAALLGWSCSRGRYRLAAITLFASLGCLNLCIFSTYLPRMDSYPEAVKFLERLNARAATAQAPVLLVSVAPARPLLYLRVPYLICQSAEEVLDCIRRQPGAYVLAPLSLEPELEKLAKLSRIDVIPQQRWMRPLDPARLAVYRREGSPSTP